MHVRSLFASMTRPSGTWKPQVWLVLCLTMPTAIALFTPIARAATSPSSGPAIAPLTTTSGAAANTVRHGRLTITTQYQQPTPSAQMAAAIANPTAAWAEDQDQDQDANQDYDAGRRR